MNKELKDMYHCIGYEYINGERSYYEPQKNRSINLTQKELKGATFIPYNYVVENVKEGEFHLLCIRSKNKDNTEIAEIAEVEQKDYKWREV